jgi:hypothetical protein
LNCRHRKVGHLFQVRFKALLVIGMPICWKVCRYVELNPVRARMVTGPGDWPWSSCRSPVGAD